MKGIILTKFRLFKRKPWLFLLMTAVCMMFAFFVGKNDDGKVKIPVYSELTQGEFHQLKESELFFFQSMNESDLRKAVKEGKVEAGLLAYDDHYTILITTQSANIPLLDQYVKAVYSEKIQKAELIASFDKKKVDQIWETAAANPLFDIKIGNFQNNELKMIDASLQGIFGFSLFFVIYTIAYNVIHILDEKRERIWDRMIVTPTKKWEMYVGNLLYSFMMGYAQVVLVFVSFRYFAGVDFHGGFAKTLIILIPYVLTIVSLCMLVAALSKSTRHFNALIPLLSVSLAMLGGAYWPIEIVSSEIMLLLGKFSPLLYGMELLKGATIHGYGYIELLKPASILLLMSVVMMGVGINVMEKRNG
ncbi:ABC transporter permease [Bacillus sp. FJAT-50079]|uniref:ABC transporter permease n=1 Tax=Bacillus sp. FJAT-50079 TaxID=2833577 RepID=UPI001BC92044|nr:ABC transporter permease [Bacillus sp. FJAT-50079]MBS4206547.1 ABC transporter permease [Bacillus sp. FJAT-50079]